MTAIIMERCGLRLRDESEDGSNLQALLPPSAKLAPGICKEGGTGRRVQSAQANCSNAREDARKKLLRDFTKPAANSAGNYFVATGAAGFALAAVLALGLAALAGAGGAVRRR